MLKGSTPEPLQPKPESNWQWVWRFLARDGVTSISMVFIPIFTHNLNAVNKIPCQLAQFIFNCSSSRPLKCLYWHLHFAPTGTLLQVIIDKPKGGRGRLGSFSSSFKESKKEIVRQCFLFTNHLLLTTRASNGRLHLAKVSAPFILKTVCSDRSRNSRGRGLQRREHFPQPTWMW